MFFFFLFLFFVLLKSSYSSAIASFSIANTGIKGWVSINDRNVNVYLNFSSVNYSLLPSVNCFAEGLHFHIHEKWNASNQNDRIGSTACGDDITGDHWDPYLACGPKSGNTHCKTYTKGCVTSSSTFDNNNVYACNSSTYAIDPYVCEVADWSGKYGTLEIVNNISQKNMSSFWEVKSSDVKKKSVVFHCANTDERAFCAPFEIKTGNEADKLMNQTNSSTENYFGAIFLKQDVIGGYFSFRSDGTYEGGFNTKNFDTCSNGYIYRIYDSWNSNKTSYIGNSTCKRAAGNVWDPTVSCLYGSDSKFCAYSNYTLCNDTSYSYYCNSTNRYSCSPSDLSGKYGEISSSRQVFWIAGRDDLFPPLNYVNGKSLVLECADHSKIIACAKITTYPYLSINMTQLSNLQSTSSGSSHQFSFAIFGTIVLLWLLSI